MNHKNRHSPRYYSDQSNGNSYQGRYQQGNYQNSTNKQTRCEYLWRKKLELELELHHVIAQGRCILADLQILQRQKELLQQQRPRLVAQIILSGLARRHALTSDEHVYRYAMERLIQDEGEMMRSWNWCQAACASLGCQIATINAEIALL